MRKILITLIQAYKLANGSLAAAFLPLAPEEGAQGLPRSTAARNVARLSASFTCKLVMRPVA